MFSLQNKVSVVTGGGSGIGRAIAELFAKQGSKVQLLERDLEAGEQAQAAIQVAGGSAELHPCDVSEPATVNAVFDKIAQQTGRTIPAESRRCSSTWPSISPSGAWANRKKSLPLALYLCSDEASFVTGCAYPIDGGVISLT